MRFRLRTLLIVLALAQVAIAVGAFNLARVVMAARERARHTQCNNTLRLAIPIYTGPRPPPSP
ncbi:MAG TPA: hypothetical protein VFB80_02420 [Pirellulaceae bacterium]|nr:hypothetical protein [Pirellulaceae bacterium]